MPEYSPKKLINLFNKQINDMFTIPIAISLSPNTQNDDVWKAFKAIIQPWRWKRGNSLYIANKWLRDYFKIEDLYWFCSGRASLFSLLKVFGIGDNHEVIIQAFTCVAVPDPIMWCGAKPVYIDIDETLNINPALIEKAITRKTKAIVVQHTFGVPAQLELITKIAHKHNIILIEDCSHSIGATYKGKKIGTFGDASFFSFGRDKVVSSVFGGAAYINPKFKTQKSMMQNEYEKLSYPSYLWIFQQLLHPIAFSIILPLYYSGIGKIVLVLLQKLHFLSKPVDSSELIGKKPVGSIKKYPNALASLLLGQLDKLNIYNRHRKKIARYYDLNLKKNSKLKTPKIQTDSIYLRYPVYTKHAQEVIAHARRKGILLGNWYKHVIDPSGVQMDKIYYKYGQCPMAEKAAMTCINLPTYPDLTMAQAEKVIQLVGKYENVAANYRN
jgi:perosamine synthetase